MVLLDAAGRVLLMRWRLEDGGAVWITPGGGVDPGEGFAEAARRELAEEVGLRDAPIGPWVWSREHVLRWKGRLILQRERFHVVRVAAHDPDRSGNDDNERRVIEEVRWWRPEEIASSSERFSPPGLAALLGPLLEGREPPEPLELRA